MVIKYYKSNSSYNISYCSRNRYFTIPVQPFAQEVQKSIKINDGAKTQIKTSIQNLCEYVTIDDTRWFVVSYLFLNGKQIILNLQRDVIGEIGISSCYGKIERGYTESVLRNRKELQLNQILKERKRLIPSNNKYGNFSVSTHEDEIWGILYLVKPSGNDPQTGEPFPEKVNINIPAFTPEVIDFPYIPNGTEKTYGDLIQNVRISFNLKFNNIDIIIKVIIEFSYANGAFQISNVNTSRTNEGASLNVSAVFDRGDSLTSESDLLFLAEQIGYTVGNEIVNNPNEELGYSFPTYIENDNAEQAYNNVTIKYNNEFYFYTTQNNTITNYGNLSSSKNTFINNYIINQIEGKGFNLINYNYCVINDVTIHNNVLVKRESNISRKSYIYNAKKLTPSEAGIVVIDTTINLVDEPYVILVFPLFETTITDGTISGTFNISNKATAFNIFNTVIEYLSGQNSYLVDAQIYPYCPDLTKVSTELQGYPFFQISSTSYIRKCNVQLLPYSDVKKEYIEREYTIISPEQTGRFTFNFYDHTNEIVDNNGINYKVITVNIKTALKPFSIISSAVIDTDSDSLYGITYGSDIRGAQPSSNGFECSLSSNAFEEYKRANSNYQQIFALQQDQLKKQHEVELANDVTSTVVNTVTATTMGAIAGGSLGDTGIGGFFGTKSAGAAVGASIAGGVVGEAMIAQTVMNSELREYEERIQKQTFDLNIGTIKNIPNSVNRISTFNEIILKDFWYVIEIRECSEYEKGIVDSFINQYGYAIGVFDYISNYYKNGWFLRSTLVKSNYPVNLHLIAEKEFNGGVYIHE